MNISSTLCWLTFCIGMLTLAALLVTFSVTTMENSLGKRSQLTSSWEDGKLSEVWGLEKWTPLTSPACFMCTPGTSLEVSFSSTKDRRSSGIKSVDNKQIRRSGRLFYCFSFLMLELPYNERVVPHLGVRRGHRKSEGPWDFLWDCEKSQIVSSIFWLFLRFLKIITIWRFFT